VKTRLKEKKLEELLYKVQESLLNQDSRIHLRDGLRQRHYIIQRCHDYLKENCFSEMNRSLSVDETTEASLFANAYYLNIRGAIDNIAWILQFKFRIIKLIEDTNSKKRMKVNLFGKEFIKELNTISKEMANIITQKEEWLKDLAQFRDPAAHRIPLYVPHATLTERRQIDKHQQLNDELVKNADKLSSAEISESYERIRNIGKFQPIFIINSEKEMKVYNISSQITADYTNYLDLTTDILTELLSSN
jgi:hypothetical protein